MTPSAAEERFYHAVAQMELGANDRDPSHYCNPGLYRFVKKTNGESASSANGPMPVGDART